MIGWHSATNFIQMFPQAFERISSPALHSKAVSDRLAVSNPRQNSNLTIWWENAQVGLSDLYARWASTTWNISDHKCRSRGKSLKGLRSASHVLFVGPYKNLFFCEQCILKGILYIPKSSFGDSWARVVDRAEKSLMVNIEGLSKKLISSQKIVFIKKDNPTKHSTFKSQHKLPRKV